MNALTESELGALSQVLQDLFAPADVRVVMVKRELDGPVPILRIVNGRNRCLMMQLDIMDAQIIAGRLREVIIKDWCDQC